MSVTFHCGDESANFSNYNARNLLLMLEFGNPSEPGICGELMPDELPAVFKRAMIHRNIEARREKYVEEEHVNGRVQSMGVSDESIRYRLDRLIELLSHGIKNKCDLDWG